MTKTVDEHLARWRTIYDQWRVDSIISEVCKAIIDPALFRAELSDEDITDIEAGRISVQYLRAVARLMAPTAQEEGASPR